MKKHSTRPDSATATAETAPHLFDNWFDPIEFGVRSRVRDFIETMMEEELEAVLSRPRYGRVAPTASKEAGSAEAAATGHRHGHRSRTLLGTFGPVEVAMPRARLNAPDGGTTEWKSTALKAYQRRTIAADAVIAATYLAGTNTRRVRRALMALFGGAVSKDTVSRTWRKVKTDWDAWNARSLADEPIVRLILDGTVVRVRLDRKATTISLLVVLGVRADGQKVLLAIKSMGGESAEAWRSVLDDLTRRGLQPPEFLIVDRAPGARQRHRRGVGRRAGPTLHRAQAQEPACARAGTSARGNHCGLQRYDLRRDKPKDRSATQGFHSQMADQTPCRGRQP